MFVFSARWHAATAMRKATRLDLEAALHSQVDMVTERGLRPRIRDRVLRESGAHMRHDREWL